MNNDTFLQDINDEIDAEELLIDLNIIEDFDIEFYLTHATCFGYELDKQIENAKSDYRKEIKPMVKKAFDILRENGFSGESIKSDEAKQLLLNNM